MATFSLCLLALFLAAPPVLALSPDVVQRGERATAMVQIHAEEGMASGSAFLIDSSGLLATDGHVVLGAQGKIQVIIRSGEADQRIVVAHVLGIDYADDLAILQISKPPDMPILPLGNSANLVPTEDVTAFGYPFGNMLAMDSKSYPTVSVNTGKITSLRDKDGQLALIQVDALVNPGNSGGPVLDDSGRVIGLVEAGVPGAGVNFATPVAKLQKFMKGPLIIIDPSTIDYQDRNRQTVFEVHVTSLLHPLPVCNLELKLTDPKGQTQTVTGTTSNGACDLSAVPVASSAAIKWNPFSGDPPPEVKFTLTVKIASQVIGTQEGAFPITGFPMGGGIIVGGGPRGGGGAKKAKKNPLDPLPDDDVETSLAGSTTGQDMREIGPGTQPPIGLHCLIGQRSDGSYAVQRILLYYSPPTRRLQNTVIAKPGYVIGGLLVDYGDFINAVRVIFVRQDGAKVDPTDKYRTRWIGKPAGTVTQVAGNGEVVVGLCGRQDNFVHAVGLVVKKSSTTQPAN